MFKQIVAREYNYSDVYLKPKKTLVNSRKECDTSVVLGRHKFILPVYAANMKSVVNQESCEFFAKNGMFYTMHRFNVDQIAFVEQMQQQGFIASISIGVNEDTIAQLKQLQLANLAPEFMTLDIANAWCNKAERMIKYVKEHFPQTFLIVGNVASADAAREVHSWGADAIKAGIAGGKVCITKNKTGFHRPMVSTVLDCATYTKKAGVPLIADGGVIEHGDIAKALACGADLIMAGSLFAGYDESAGNIIEVSLDGSRVRSYKEYYGSASQYNKGEYKNVEGKKILIDYKGSMEKLVVELIEDLQSSISYVGGVKANDLINAEIICIS